MVRSLLLSCESVSKTYGTRPLFEDLSFVLAEGDQVGLVGPNGSGKSTLLKILAGLESPDRGTRSVRGNVRVGYVPQDPVLPAGVTVEQVIALALPEMDEGERPGRVALALGRAGFADARAAVDALSGGWKKRLAIAHALAAAPDVLLMDEPTNHLDVEGILWLESILAERVRAVLVVSHDRYFLEHVATRMLELSRAYSAGLFQTDGRYSDFLARLDDARARATTGAVGIDFTSSQRRTRRLLVARGLSKSFGDHSLIRGLDLTVTPGTRIGLIGPNGSGKTTLLNLIAGTLAPDAGEIEHAEGLRLVRFEQHRPGLDPEQSLRRALSPDGDTVTFQSRTVHVASWAKRFLFRPEQLEVPVGRLSGGEQARILIARLMCEPADLLILDEPTNDLDISTLEVLEDSLAEFEGGLVLVTHDRYMLDRVSTMILALDGAGGAQTYADYAQWEAARPQQAPAPRVVADELPARERPRTKRLGYLEQREWEGMEQAILAAETAVAACRGAAEDPGIASDPAALQTRYAALEAARAEVARLYDRWAELEGKQA